MPVDFHLELMQWMPPADGITMCQSDVSKNVTQRREHPLHQFSMEINK
jgi:hypothetical protein